MYNEAIKNYVEFKLAQINRLSKSPLSGDDLKSWVEFQIKNKTDLIKSVIKDAIHVVK